MGPLADDGQPAQDYLTRTVAMCAKVGTRSNAGEQGLVDDAVDARYSAVADVASAGADPDAGDAIDAAAAAAVAAASNTCQSPF